VNSERKDPMPRRTTKDCILAYLAARPNEVVFLRSEFSECAKSRSAVDRALRALIDEEVLVRGGWGIYVRAKRVEFLGREYVGTVTGFDYWYPEVLAKLGVTWEADSARKAYNEGHTTQVPAWTAVNVGRQRITRRIAFGKRVLQYERTTGARRRKVRPTSASRRQRATSTPS